MKTKKITKTFITLIAVTMLTMIVKQVNATNYLILEVNTITNNDSVYYCPTGYDSIMIIANGGNGGNNTWIYLNYSLGWGDTIRNNHSDTLILPKSSWGEIQNTNSISGFNYFFICPIYFYVTGSTAISCGGSTNLNTLSNYTGTGSITYSWLPVTGLNNPNIANPVANPNSTTYYTMTAMVNGCAVVDTVKISIIPVSAPEICIVGVDSAKKNMIVWNKPLSTEIDSFYIYRETSMTNVYQKIGIVSYDSFSVFIDTNSFPDVQSNKYELSIIDKCRIESGTSTSHKTMHLNINQGINLSWDLAWEPYEGFTVSTYRIYRGTTNSNMQLIGTTSGTSTQYSDYTAPSGYVYYMVEVVSPNNCNPSKSYNSSRSNIATNHPLGINENSNAENLFSIFPNPATNNLTIQTQQQATLEILNIQGQIIKTFETKENKTNVDHVGWSSYVVDVSAFSRGVYMISVETEKGIWRGKFVKE